MGIQSSGIMRTQETEIVGRRKAVSTDRQGESTGSAESPTPASRILVRAYETVDPTEPETSWATGLHISEAEILK